MKRIVSFILIAIFLLCGCTPKETCERTLPKSFNSEAEILIDGVTYTAYMTRYTDCFWKVELTAPEAVKGLIFNVNGDETEIAFKGLHFTFDTSKFPVGSVVSKAVRSFDRLAPLTLDLVKGETADYASGDINGMVYSISLDKNGTPVSLELGDCGMKISFITFEEIEEPAPNNTLISG